MYDISVATRRYQRFECLQVAKRSMLSHRRGPVVCEYGEAGRLQKTAEDSSEVEA